MPGAGPAQRLPASPPEWAEAERSDTGHGGGHGAGPARHLGREGSGFEAVLALLVDTAAQPWRCSASIRCRSNRPRCGTFAELLHDRGVIDLLRSRSSTWLKKNIGAVIRHSPHVANAVPSENLLHRDIQLLQHGVA